MELKGTCTVHVYTQFLPVYTVTASYTCTSGFDKSWLLDTQNIHVLLEHKYKIHETLCV